jgi:transposase
MSELAEKGANADLLREMIHEMYKRRNEIERLFRRLKGFRRIFSRFDKLISP